MPSVLTITLNPAVDKSFTVERLEPDHKLRCPNPQVDAGGGGINVARGIKRLGGDVNAFVVTGGHNGSRLREMLVTEGIETSGLEVSGETRESIMIIDSSVNRQYRIIAEGPNIKPDESEAVLDAIRTIDPFPSYVVASGSLPAGLPEDYYARIASLVKSKGSRFILDTGGMPLQKALSAGLFLVKPNLRELSMLSGKEELQLDEVDDAAMQLIRTGHCEIVVVSLGAAGAMYVNRHGYRHFPAPQVKRKSTVGAGDSMVAGMVWALQKGLDADEMVRYGIACGTAATLQPGTQLFQVADVERLHRWLVRQS
jgi:6-phosphofructokinase 2